MYVCMQIKPTDNNNNNMSQGLLVPGKGTISGR